MRNGKRSRYMAFVVGALTSTLLLLACGSISGAPPAPSPTPKGPAFIVKITGNRCGVHRAMKGTITVTT